MKYIISFFIFFTFVSVFISCERNDMFRLSQINKKLNSRIIAVDNTANSYIFISDDNGETWFQTSPQGMWSSVASSRDGLKLAATVYAGYIYMSADGGLTWTQRYNSLNWTSIASSSDGVKLCAVNTSPSGFTHNSTDSGASWLQGSVGPNAWLQVISTDDGTKAFAVDGSNNNWIYKYDGATWGNLTMPVAQTYSSVASSADGMKLAVGTLSGTVYISADMGTTWTPTTLTSVTSQYISSSADGTKLAVAVQAGNIYISSDSGSTWYSRATVQNWTSIASSQDGTRLAACTSGGYIYTSDDSGMTWNERSSAGLRTWKNIIITR